MRHLHTEKHFASTAVVRDVVIGMSDGLTVPFALAAGLTGGLTGSINASHVIITAGLAEIAAGSIAMGLGGYLAARTDREHFQTERSREDREVEEKPEIEALEVAEVFEGYGLSPEQIEPIVAALRRDKTRWVDFMMRFELGLEEPDPRRAARSALTIAGSYIAGGMIPLAPYMLLDDVQSGLWVSTGVTLLALTLFGYIKGRLTGTHPIRGAAQTALIGGLAAAAAFGIARMIGG
ncbi:MAG: VIT1/CCC1 transporter family protein [Planctomycetota bacterium]|nr:VIT1/CCC1 transporter family protein [Planctomycetota bacterium]